jgi:hypothetical protein
MHTTTTTAMHTHLAITSMKWYTPSTAALEWGPRARWVAMRCAAISTSVLAYRSMHRLPNALPS